MTAHRNQHSEFWRAPRPQSSGGANNGPSRTLVHPLSRANLPNLTAHTCAPEMEGVGTPPQLSPRDQATQMRFAAATGQAAARGALRLAQQQSESAAATAGGSDPSHPAPAADGEAQDGGEQQEPSGSRHEQPKREPLSLEDAGGSAGSGQPTRGASASSTPPAAAPPAAQPPAARPAAQPSASLPGARD